MFKFILLFFILNYQGKKQEEKSFLTKKIMPFTIGINKCVVFIDHILFVMLIRKNWKQIEKILQSNNFQNLYKIEESFKLDGFTKALKITRKIIQTLIVILLFIKLYDLYEDFNSFEIRYVDFFKKLINYAEFAGYFFIQNHLILFIYSLFLELIYMVVYLVDISVSFFYKKREIDE